MSARARFRMARGERAARSAAGHSAAAARDLGRSVTRLSSAGTHYAGWQAKRAAGSLADSDLSQRVQSGAAGAGARAGKVVDTTRRRTRRAVTAGLLVTLGVVAKQVRSQPVPPGVEP